MGKNEIYNISVYGRVARKKPWLYPRDSFERLFYYPFENNKRLRYVYTNVEMEEYPGDLNLNPMTRSYFTATHPDGTPYFSEPVMYVDNYLWSERHEKVQRVTPGAFNDLGLLSPGIWWGVIVACFAITAVETIQSGLRGLRITPHRVFNILSLYFGALLAKGFTIRPWPAVKICAGLWILFSIIFINLLSGTMKASYVNQKRVNIDSLEDAFLRPDIILRVIDRGVATELCKPKKKIIHDCSNGDVDMYFKNLFKPKKNRTVVVFSDLPGIHHMFAKTRSSSWAIGLYRGKAHVSSQKYFTTAKVYFFSSNITKEAAKLFNARLRTFVETDQLAVWYRSFENFWGVRLHQEREDDGEVEVFRIGLKELKMAFALWALLLLVAFIICALELIFNVCC